MSNKPLVSIGLPTYNRALTLRRAIESALTQDYPNIELVISDNASTDETEAICLEACRSDGRVKYLRQQKNHGAVTNFREVLKQSRGEFFMWLSDDDWLGQSYVGRCLEVLLERPDYSLVCAKSKYFKEREFISDGMVVNLPQDSGSDRVLAYYAQVADNGTLYGVMRRTQVLELPLRSTMGADWLFIAAVAFMGKVETLEDTYVNRSLGGATDSYKKIAATLGLSSFAAAHPHLSIAASAFSDIVWKAHVYSKKGIFSRLRLGCKVFLLVARRDNGFSWSFYLPRRIAAIAMTKLLPAHTVDKIRTRRREAGRGR